MTAPDSSRSPVVAAAGYFSCLACGHEFDPIATRWFCPHCKFKANCCEGEALPFGPG